MNLIFNKDHTVDDISIALTSHIIKGVENGSIQLPMPLVPTMTHWVKFGSFKVQVLEHPSQIAKRIVQALKLDSFKDHKAHITFTSGMMHVFITDSDVLEMPAVLNMPVQGSA